MTRTLLLIVHVAAGSTGLVLGALAMAAPKGAGCHPRVGRGYQLAVAAVTVTAVALAALDWARLWWLALIAVATEAAAIGGLWTRRRQPPGWRPLHVRLMCGSYVSLVTAFLVVNWSSPVAWVLPTLVAAPLIGRAAKRAAVAPVATAATG